MWLPGCVTHPGVTKGLCGFISLHILEIVLSALKNLKPAHEEWAHFLNLLKVLVRPIVSTHSRTLAGNWVSGMKNSYTHPFRLPFPEFPALALFQVLSEPVFTSCTTIAPSSHQRGEGTGGAVGLG